MAIIKVKPLLRGHFHQAMFFTALGACVPLIARCHNRAEYLSVGIYSICTFAMLGISTLYHRVTWTPEQRQQWKKYDHCGIYLMIAGTFTPVGVLALNETSCIKLLSTIWAVAIIGILQSIFFVNLPKMISSALYLVAGYLILPYLNEIEDRIGLLNFWLILSGGFSYSIGAIIYGLKRPILNPNVFSYHELFHIFVNIGVILHFIVIHSLIH
jgi:hemolysin III